VAHRNNKNTVLTLEQCMKILNRGERKYSEKEIREIREFLYLVAEFENNDYNTENDECNNLLQS
jgi:hypothetical protein